VVLMSRVLCLDSVQYRDVVVEIERATVKKPFLGGYRHKQTGAVYHHATAQTVPRYSHVNWCLVWFGGQWRF